jgi:hypothetical protein
MNIIVFVLGKSAKKVLSALITGEIKQLKMDPAMTQIVSESGVESSNPVVPGDGDDTPVVGIPYPADSSPTSSDEPRVLADSPSAFVDLTPSPPWDEDDERSQQFSRTKSSGKGKIAAKISSGKKSAKRWLRRSIGATSANLDMAATSAAEHATKQQKKVSISGPLGLTSTSNVVLAASIPGTVATPFDQAFAELGSSPAAQSNNGNLFFVKSRTKKNSTSSITSPVSSDSSTLVR